MKTGAGNLKKGEFVNYNNEIWQVQKAEFYSPGKGSALMKIKMKNIVSAKNVDYTYKTSETVETFEVESIEMQYLYKDGDFAYFMDERTYNQYQLSLDIIGDAIKFFKEGSKYYVYVYNEKPLNVRPSLSEKFKIVETEDAVKGDTVSGGKKTAVLENGAKVMVPLFIKQGEVITVNPETGEYTGRV